MKTPLILHYGKLKNTILLVISALFVYLGINLIETSLWIGMLNIVFFGLCSLIALINFFPNASYLKNEEIILLAEIL